MKNEMNVNDLKGYAKDFDDNKLKDKFMKFARVMGGEVVYVACVLWEMINDDNVEFHYKLGIAGALGYLILPVDLIPDWLPAVGYADDMAAMMAVVDMYRKMINVNHKEKAIAKVKEFLKVNDKEAELIKGCLDAGLKAAKFVDMFKANKEKANKENDNKEN